jgi:hypothetical protein
MRCYVDSQDLAGGGVRVVFNGFRKIACSPGFHGEVILEIGLRSTGVISLTADAEKLSATAYPGESVKFWLTARSSVNTPQTDNYRSIQPRGRGGWCRRI